MAAAATAATLTASRLTASVGGVLHAHSAKPAFHAKLASFSPRRFSPAAISFPPRRRLFSCTALQKPEFKVKEEGTKETLDYRVFFIDSAGKKVSPWHDIPLNLGDGVFNFVVEIPKNSSAKMEVATDEPFTPIKQDTKKGILRYYPFNINWNYGLLPQTWEDPSYANLEVDGALGDNDPVDVIEIGDARAKIGEVLKIKPLAAWAMIDEGELDWKIVAISLNDPRASLLNDMNDVEIHFPGTLTAIRDWFRDYKIPDGKPANQFGLGNKPVNKIHVYVYLEVSTSCKSSIARYKALTMLTNTQREARNTRRRELRHLREDALRNQPSKFAPNDSLTNSISNSPITPSIVFRPRGRRPRQISAQVRRDLHNARRRELRHIQRNKNLDLQGIHEAASELQEQSVILPLDGLASAFIIMSENSSPQNCAVRHSSNPTQDGELASTDLTPRRSFRRGRPPRYASTQDRRNANNARRREQRQLHRTMHLTEHMHGDIASTTVPPRPSRKRGRPPRYTSVQDRRDATNARRRELRQHMCTIQPNTQEQMPSSSTHGKQLGVP